MAIVVRDPRVALQLVKLTSLPVLLARWLADVDQLMNTYQPEVVLYVNQNVSNFDVLAYARPQHVFLSHGESDKVYMVSNQAKAYDLTFVAGRAAVDRYRAALHDFDTDAKLRVIGPQLHVSEPPPTDLPTTSLPKTVVYAPTTEGQRGPDGVRVVGQSRRRHGAGAAVQRAVPGHLPAASAGGKAPVDRRHRSPSDRGSADLQPGGHYVDRTPRFGWQREVADALVCDISAVAVDWLPTGKPLVVTRPAQPWLRF